MGTRLTSAVFFCVVTPISALSSMHTLGAQSGNFYNLTLQELGQVEITTATGNNKPLEKAPATASVITADEIRAMGAKILDDVLEAIPGFHISLSALNRLDSIYSIRGIHTGFNPHVLVLMNSVPVQFSTQGRPILLRLPVTSIERVEVIRGPGSAIYGADAYSGVINIITKDATTSEESKVGLRSGSFNNRDFWLSNGKKFEDLNVFFSFTYLHSDGDDSRQVDSDLQSTLDAALGTNASLARGPLSTRYEVIDTHISLNNDNWTINLWSWNSHNSGVGAGAAQALDPRGNDDSDLYQGDITYSTDTLFKNWDSSIRLNYHYYDTQASFNLLPENTVVPIGADGNVNFTAPAGIVLFTDGLIGNPGGTTKDSQIDIINSYLGWEQHRWRIAIGARRQSLNTRETKNFGPGVIDGSQPAVDGSLTDVTGTPFIFANDVSRTIRYISVQDEWRFATDWELTAGLRYDDYSDFGSTTNPRVALVWSTHEKLTSKLLYGSAFRAPTFSEQFNQNNPVSLGNSNLEPEIIDTTELSFTLSISSKIKSTLNLFTYSARDMIEFVPDGEAATTSTARNARDQKGMGFEWEINSLLSSNFRLNTNYSWQEPEDKDTGTPIADAPQQQFTLTSLWEFLPDWSLYTKVNWVGDRARAVGDPRPEIDDYTLIDMTLRKENLIQGLDLSFSIRNLIDEDAREPSSPTIPDDYPLEKRGIWAEVSYSLK